MMNQPIRNCLLVVIGSLLFTLGSLQAQAQSACTGLSTVACQGKDTCSWVKGYTTKSGTTVKAYCRLKPGRKSAADQTERKATKQTKSGKNTSTSVSETATERTTDEKPKKKMAKTPGKEDKVKTPAKKSSSEKSAKDVNRKSTKAKKSKKKKKSKKNEGQEAEMKQ